MYAGTRGEGVIKAYVHIQGGEGSKITNSEHIYFIDDPEEIKIDFFYSSWKSLICFLFWTKYVHKISNLLLPFGAVNLNIPKGHSLFSFAFLLSSQRFLVVRTTDNFCLSIFLLAPRKWICDLHFLFIFFKLFFIILMETDIFFYLFLLFKLLLSWKLTYKK